MKGPCQRSISSFEAYAAGALQGRQRRVVEDHLNGCATCRAELTLTQAVQEARAGAAAPLAEERARRIFRGVQQTLESPAPTPRARRGWQLALALSGAAVLLVVALLLVNRQRTKPPPQGGRWIARSHGVRAWAEPGSVASFARRAGGVELALQRGALLVAFEQDGASGPLKVRAPGADLIARSATFFVAAGERVMTVGVRRGDLQLRWQGHAAERITADEQVQVAGYRATRQRIDVEWLRGLASRLGDEPVGQNAPRDTQPSDPAIEGRSSQRIHPRGRHADNKQRSRHPRRSRRAPARGTVRTPPPAGRGAVTAKDQLQGGGRPGPSATAAIAAAQQHLGRGETAQARQLLRRALSTATLTVGEREELLYLLAASLRRERRFRESADVLRQLAASSKSHAARLAGLERARLLAYNLKQPKQALRLLEHFVGRGGRDALTQQAWEELCMLQVEQRAREDARRCIDTYLRRFSSARRNKKMLELRDRLERLRER